MLSIYSSSCQLALILALSIAYSQQRCECQSQLLDCTNSTVIPQSSCQPTRGHHKLRHKTSSHRSRVERNTDTNVLCKEDSSTSSSQKNAASSLVCKPLVPNTTVDEDEDKAMINVFIRTPRNETHFKAGSSLTIECRFSTTTLNQDLKFNLRWLRSVNPAESKNQSVSYAEAGDLTLTVIDATSRVWTVQKNEGLDLIFNDFHLADTGKYFCQALTLETNIILSEAQIQVKLLNLTDDLESERNVEFSDKSKSLQQIVVDHPPTNDQTDSESRKSEQLVNELLYSPDNLAKLLPALKVIPSFSELDVGGQVQLACVTIDIATPDPDPSEIEWNFQRIPDRRSQPMLKKPDFSRNLPNNTSVFGNILMIWSMSSEHAGIYSCHYRIKGFNLSVEAVGELALRPQEVSASPLVYVSPDVARLKLNDSTTLQCEATGYPPPKLVWFWTETVERLILGETPEVTDAKNGQRIVELNSSSSNEVFGESGFELEPVNYKDTVVYCHQMNCTSTSKFNSTHLITAISLLHLKHTRAQYQGQYICRASNDQGINQASTIVDVEYREPPLVVIDAKYRKQTIELKHDKSVAEEEQAQNATFICNIEAGRPQPRMRWLRVKSQKNSKTSPQRQVLKLPATKNQNQDFEIYDLTRVSSATSKVYTWLENSGKTLVLVLSIISLDDEGEYVCLGENEWGRHSAVARLVVRRPISLKIAQSSPLTAKLNSSFQIDCLVSGHPLPIDLEWSRSDRGLVFFSPVSKALSNIQESQEKAMLKFDKISQEDAGEYTCYARDPLNPDGILRDTIMIVVGGNEEQKNHNMMNTSYHSYNDIPKLVIKPVKTTARVGENVTLDCLTVSGLQPTIVEWLAPPVPEQLFVTTLATPTTILNQNTDMLVAESSNSILSLETAYIRPYYHKATRTLFDDRVYQFGSKLKITNITKAHEGVYQCKARNRLGTENAPAYIKVLSIDENHVSKNQPASQQNSSSKEEIRTKIAKLGLNIELKCQVNGVDEPATSWSRNGQELPKSSVQIESNLWIQNVSIQDSGLYICSARSTQPNKVIQAKINLLVDETLSSDEYENKRIVKNLTAKIVPSKSMVNTGDSITLECIITQQQKNSSNIQASHMTVSDESVSTTSSSFIDLDEIERNVIWTNLHSGQSLFQDNVYIQENLLIIYGLKQENSATYRCNYNELTQHVDYKLEVKPNNQDLIDGGTNQINPLIGTNNQTNSTELIFSDKKRVELRQIPIGSDLEVECSTLLQRGQNQQNLSYYWTVGNENHQSAKKVDNPLLFQQIKTRDADIYHCYVDLDRQSVNDGNFTSPTFQSIVSVIIKVTVPIARFLQRPISFVTLPTISGANHQLDVELKFLPEQENGLILYNGQQQQLSSTGTKLSHATITNGDFISLGMTKGYLEFRFELGDGTTLLRSSQPLALNQWHKVVIERNRRGAVMWLDKQPPVSNSSAGKFFNLNLDSVLYIGGLPQLSLNKTTNNTRSSLSSSRFYGYRRGFHGCISLMKISQVEINLMSRNRSVSVGVYECDKSDCKDNECSTNGICQVERSYEVTTESEGKSNLRFQLPIDSTKRASLSADLRCLCGPGFIGRYCSDRVDSSSERSSLTNYKEMNVSEFNNPVINQTVNFTTTTVSMTMSTKQSLQNRACELLVNPCSTDGTIECQSFTSTSYKCHCKLGFMGETCSQQAQFLQTNSVAFEEGGYLQFKFNKPEDAQAMFLKERQKHQKGITQQGQLLDDLFNATSYQKKTSMAERQEISFSLRTKSSYGLILYTGQLPNLRTTIIPNNHISSSSTTLTTPMKDSSSITSSASVPTIQTSKSMIVNLLASRISMSGSPSSNMPDYLAIALVDGHIELSYELGSGVAIIRSSQRFNDDEQHQINVIRNGKNSRLIIDSLHIFDGQSPGKLSMLNSHPEANYLGGFPLQSSSNSADVSTSSSTYKSNLGFIGCLSNLEINSVGPMNLVESNYLIQIVSARNLRPCTVQETTSGINKAPRLPSTLPPTTSPKLYLQSSTTTAESDDPDEM